MSWYCNIAFFHLQSFSINQISIESVYIFLHFELMSLAHYRIMYVLFKCAYTPCCSVQIALFLYFFPLSWTDEDMKTWNVVRNPNGWVLSVTTMSVSVKFNVPLERGDSSSSMAGVVSTVLYIVWQCNRKYTKTCFVFSLTNSDSLSSVIRQLHTASTLWLEGK